MATLRLPAPALVIICHHFQLQKVTVHIAGSGLDLLTDSGPRSASRQSR